LCVLFEQMKVKFDLLRLACYLYFVGGFVVLSVLCPYVFTCFFFRRREEIKLFQRYFCIYILNIRVNDEKIGGACVFFGCYNLGKVR